MVDVPQATQSSPGGDGPGVDNCNKFIDHAGDALGVDAETKVASPIAVDDSDLALGIGPVAIDETRFRCLKSSVLFEYYS